MIRVSKIRIPIELDSKSYILKKLSKKLDIKQELIKSFGGIHSWMNWHKPGRYQGS